MQKYLMFFMLLFMIGCNRQVEEIPKLEGTTVTLEPTYEKPTELLDQEGVHYIKGNAEGEYLIVTVEGVLKDVALVGLTFNDNGELREDEVIQAIGDLEDEVVVIESYHAEGIPSERLVWSSEDGMSGSYTFAENGKDGLGVEIYEYE